MKLLVDMNLSPRWVGVLAGAGLEAAHWSTLGANNARDSEIMAYASANDYVVLPTIWTSAQSLPPRTAKGRASCRFVPRTSVRKRLASK